jgi:hypothetical protein
MEREEEPTQWWWCKHGKGTRLSTNLEREEWTQKHNEWVEEEKCGLVTY